jgi:hypothetical protein
LADGKGRTLAELEHMHPRDLATFVDIWEEQDADRRR